MQNAKDTFYQVLRDRLASVNPERTIVVRGVTRPAVLVDENEVASAGELAECFHVRWKTTNVASEGSLPLLTLHCEITYRTGGSSWNGGLDRGRVLAAMDAELLTAVRMSPQNTPKKSFAGLAQGGAAEVLASRIWWSDVSFAAVTVEGGQLQRAASVDVMCFQEVGEL